MAVRRFHECSPGRSAECSKEARWAMGNPRGRERRKRPDQRAATVSVQVYGNVSSGRRRRRWGGKAWGILTNCWNRKGTSLERVSGTTTHSHKRQVFPRRFSLSAACETWLSPGTKVVGTFHVPQQPTHVTHADATDRSPLLAPSLFSSQHPSSVTLME
jgi:hypothetical protein